MAYTLEKISGNQVRLNFTVPAEQFESAMQKAYLKQRGRINVPGFRKGKAPRKLIENMFGEAAFYDDAFDILFPDVYNEAVDKENLEAVDQPQIDLGDIGTGKDLTFTATVYVSPDVTLGEYKGLKATKYVPPVSDEQLDERIGRDVEKTKTVKDVADRPVKTEDDVIIDYSGSVNGVKFEGGTAENHHLKIGSNQFIPGFEEQLVGLNIGEEKDVTVTFPEEYHAEDLAGKEAVFHVKLHSIQEELRPELDDEFAADVSEFTTFKEYKESIAAEMTDIIEKNADVEVENNLIQLIVDASDCDIPPRMIESEIDQQVRNMQLRMAYQGLKYEDYLKYTGMTEQNVRDMFTADAKNSVKTQLVIESIRKQENIEAKDQDAEEEVARRAAETGREVEEYRASLSEHQMEHFIELAAIRKVIDLIKANADITVKNEKKPETIDPEEVLAQTEEAAQAADESGKPVKRPRASTKKAATKKNKAESPSEQSSDEGADRAE